MTVIARDLTVEVCIRCGTQLSNGRTPTGRCPNRDHWSAGGRVVKVVPADQLAGAVEALRAADLLADAVMDGLNEGGLMQLVREFHAARTSALPSPSREPAMHESLTREEGDTK